MNKYLKLFFHRVGKDFKQKDLRPLKLLFFMHSSTILVLYPYLTIHMRELGINVEETAIMSAVTPAVAILMPPLAGMIADKIGNFRIILAFFSVIGGLSALLLLLVPVGRITLTYPNDVLFGLSCGVNTSPLLTLYQEHSCVPLSDSRTFESQLQLKSCGIACQADLTENYTSIIMGTEKYDIQIYDIQRNKTLTYTYKLLEEDREQPEAITKSRNHKKLKNHDRYLTSLRKLSSHTYYFPTNMLYNFSCDVANSSEINCLLGSKDQLDQFKKNINNPMTVGLRARNLDSDDHFENRQIYDIEYIDNVGNSNLKCLQDPSITKRHISVVIPVLNETENKIKHLDLGICSPRCIMLSPRKQVCSNMKTVVEIDMQLTFVSYLLIRVFVGIVSGTSFAMFEGAVIAILREHKADYGLQRIYATFGGMISSPLSGWLIDFASRGKGYTDFRPIFFLYAALKIVSGVLMLFINLEFKKPATTIVADVIAVLKKLELIALFLSCLILGCVWGFIENYLFWLLEDLGGSKSLMGLTITVGGIVGIPLLVLSGPIIKKFGHANVIFIGFVFYAVRLLGYSLIYNPWLCLIFEAMESITFGLSFTSAVTYAAKLSTVTTDTSIQGMLGGLYYGVGKGVGSLVGGYMIKSIGIRYTFQSFSVVTLITGVIYLGFYHLYMKQRPSAGTDITKKDVEKEKSPDFDEINLKAKLDLKSKPDINDIPVSYEDALCNPAFEPTEEDLEELEKTNESINKVRNGQVSIQ